MKHNSFYSYVYILTSLSQYHINNISVYFPPASVHCLLIFKSTCLGWLLLGEFGETRPSSLKSILLLPLSSLLPHPIGTRPMLRVHLIRLLAQLHPLRADHPEVKPYQNLQRIRNDHLQ